MGLFILREGSRYTLISYKLLHYESDLPHSEKVKMGFNNEGMYCVVPENIHNSPRMVFGSNPPTPLEFPVLLHTFPFGTPSPSEFPMAILAQGGYRFFSRTTYLPFRLNKCCGVML